MVGKIDKNDGNLLDIPRNDTNEAFAPQQDESNVRTPPRAQPPLSLKEKNRRKRWLDTHPEYFGSDLESAGEFVPWYLILYN